MSSGALRQGMMMKRARRQSAMGPINWKARFFVLLPEELSYWDEFGGATNSQAKKKGALAVASIRAVEEVPDTTFSRPFMFQVVHGDNAVLYMQSSDAADRQEWLCALRRLVPPAHRNQSFHPGVFDSRWSCCGDPNRSTIGCQPCSNYNELLSSAASAVGAAAAARSASPPPQPLAAGPKAEAANGRGRPPAPRALAPASLPASASASASSLSASSPQPGATGLSYALLPPSSAAPPKAAAPLPSATSPPPGGKALDVRVMYSYTASQPGDLSITEGDKLTVLDQSEPNWWKARDAQGRVGFIPSNYVRPAGLESEPWFHGRISRAEAAALLLVAKQEGCFLVRESESKVGEYSLSVSHGDSLRHYHIKNQNNEFYINERHRFADIPKLIEYHKLNSGGLVTRLRKSIADLHAPPTAGLGHDKWELDVNDFTIGKQLGSGQFGVVHEALYIGGTKPGGIKVAVKMMKQGSMSEDDFLSEALVMKNFNHANLVQLYGVCTRTRPMWIVVELMAQGCLLDYLRGNADLQQRPEVIHYMGVQIAAAMSYLEGMRFIHRDLAARNCLLGDKFVVKVADFGLARFVIDDEYTASEGTKFPIKWAAPEVISYARFSTKSDVWSFAITLWELWTLGRQPYPTFTNAEVVDKVVDGYRLPRPPLASMQVYQLMLDAWHKDPDCRPSFAEIVRRLEENKADYEDSVIELS